jgi:RNA polymerase sigma-70 factor (ECF subfamily)
MDSPEGFEAVLAAAQRGEEWAAEVLYRDVRPRLARFLQVREARVADDIEGEVWLAVAEGIARFSGTEESFRAWVFSIARRRLADFRRTAVRRSTFPVPADELDRPTQHWPESLVLEDLSAEAAAEFVTAVLPPDQADVVLLRVLAGLGVEEVAEILDKPAGTVRVMQHRALRRLHEQIVRLGVTP